MKEYKGYKIKPTKGSETTKRDSNPYVVSHKELNLLEKLHLPHRGKRRPTQPRGTDQRAARKPLDGPSKGKHPLPRLKQHFEYRKQSQNIWRFCIDQQTTKPKRKEISQNEKESKSLNDSSKRRMI